MVRQGSRTQPSGDKKMRAREFITPQQPITEDFILTPILLNWAKKKAISWLRNHMAEKGRGYVAGNETLTKVDQSIASALGQQDKAVGSILTAYVMALIETGSPIDAAIKTGTGIAKEMIMQSDTVQGFKAQALAQLGQLEPLADQWEALISRRQQTPAPIGQAGEEPLEPIDQQDDPLDSYINPPQGAL